MLYCSFNLYVKRPLIFCFFNLNNLKTGLTAKLYPILPKIIEVFL